MIGLLRGSGVLASGVSEAWLMGVSLPRLSVVHVRRRRRVLAVQAAGAAEDEAKARVAALGGLEHGVLAIGGCAAAIAVLVSGRGQPAADFTIPWAVIPIPGFLIGFWAADRYHDRFRDRAGWRA